MRVNAGEELCNKLGLKSGEGDGVRIPLLNLCASYGVCTTINICYELQQLRSAPV